MLDKGGKAQRLDILKGGQQRAIKCLADEQRARVVVDAITMQAIRNAADGVLEQTGIVAHCGKVSERQHGQRRPLLAAGRPKRLAVGEGGIVPGHRPARTIGSPPHRKPRRIVGQQTGHSCTEADRIIERHQHARAIGQQFGGMPVGRRDHGPAEAVRVGQRARRHLRLDKVGRHVDIAHGDVVEQFRPLGKAVEEHHVSIKSECMDARNQAFAVGFTFRAQQGGVGCAHHDIDRVRRGCEHHGHGLDHHLDALVRADQAEGEDHLTIRETQFPLGLLRIGQRRVRNAVGDDHDAGGIGAVDLDEDRAGLAGHDHNPRRGSKERHHHRALRLARPVQHGVQRGDERHTQSGNQA